MILLYFIFSVLSLPLLLSKELRTPGSAPHNRWGRINFFGSSLAIIDVAPTIIVGIIMAMVTKTSVFITVPALFLTGMVIHFIFDIKTPLNMLIGL